MSTANPDSKLWIVGVVITIVATVVSNGGINLQKLSIMRELSKPRPQQRAYVLQPLWLLGFVGVVGGAVGDFGSLAFAAQSLLIPLGGFTIVANIGFARVCLGERMTRRDFVATVLILIGIIMIAVTGSKEEQSFTLAQLIALYSEPAFIGYLIVVGFTIVFLLLYTRYASSLKRQYGPWSKQYAKVHRSHVFAMPMLAGVLGAQTIWIAKSVAEMVKTSAKGDNQVIYFGFWAMLIAMVATVISQLHFLSMSLKIAPALLAIPVFHSIFILLSIIGGGVYFKELQHMTGVQLGVFMLGLIILLAGMWLLSQRKVEGSTPPSKFLLAGLIVRFIIRTRNLLRAEEADKWPNRLHLYHCDCGCHLGAVHGVRKSIAVLGRGGVVLETIADEGDENEVDDDLDEFDYARARGLGDGLGGWEGVAVGMERREVPPHLDGPAAVTQRLGAGPSVAAPTTPVGVDDVVAEVTNPAVAEASPLPSSPAAPALPRMCPRCFCRITPNHVREARKANRRLQPAAHALLHTLPNAGTASIDAGISATPPTSSGKPSPHMHGGAVHTLPGPIIGAYALLPNGSPPPRPPAHVAPTSMATTATIKANLFPSTLFGGGGALPAAGAAPLAGVADGAGAGGGSEWEAAYADVMAQEQARKSRASATVPSPRGPVVPFATTVGTSGTSPGVSSAQPAPTPPATAATAPTTTTFPTVLGVAPGGSTSQGDAMGSRRYSRHVTKEEVASIMHPSRRLELGSLAFYNASNPAVPSYLAKSGSGGGGGYEADSDGDDDDEDVVSQALDHLGEGLARLRAKTQESFRFGLSAMSAKLRLPASTHTTGTVAEGGGAGTTTSPRATTAPMVAHMEPGEAALEATATGRPRTGTAPSPPPSHGGMGGGVGVGASPPSAALTGAAAAALNLIKPATAAAAGLVDGEVAARLEGFERMKEEDGGTAGPAPRKPSTGRARGDTSGVSDGGYVSSGGGGGGGASYSEDEGGGTSTAVAVGDGGGGQSAPRKSAGRRSTHRRRAGRHASVFDNTMPMPGAMVVGAGLEGLSAVTIAALKKLFTQGAGPIGGTAADAVGAVGHGRLDSGSEGVPAPTTTLPASFTVPRSPSRGHDARGSVVARAGSSPRAMTWAAQPAPMVDDFTVAFADRAPADAPTTTAFWTGGVEVTTPPAPLLAESAGAHARMPPATVEAPTPLAPAPTSGTAGPTTQGTEDPVP